MRIITKQELSNGAAKLWKDTYFNNGEWLPIPIGRSKKEIYSSLVSLGECPTPDMVDNEIGNVSWTRLTCNECGKDVEIVVEIGEPEDCDSRTVILCKDCLSDALHLVR